MPIIYETYAKPVLKRPVFARRRGFQQEKQYNLLDPDIAKPPLPSKLKFGVFTGGSLRKDAYVDVTWDEKVTTMTQCLLTWSAHHFGAYYLMETRMYVNDVVVSARDMDAPCAVRGNLEGLNIGVHMKNGTNKFSIEVRRSWGVLESGIDAITAFFVAQFEGKEPSVKPPPPTWWPYLKYGLIGVGAIAAVGITVPLIMKWRRK